MRAGLITTELKRQAKPEKQWDTGSVYKGEWKDNKRHSYGIQIWSNGNKYEGEWAHGNREGHGVFRSRGGATTRHMRNLLFLRCLTSPAPGASRSDPAYRCRVSAGSRGGATTRHMRNLLFLRCLTSAATGDRRSSVRAEGGLGRHGEAYVLSLFGSGQSRSTRGARHRRLLLQVVF
jgi:hypothetical protein